MSCKQFDAYYNTVPTDHPISSEDFDDSVEAPKFNPKSDIKDGEYRWVRPLKDSQ